MRPPNDAMFQTELFDLRYWHRYLKNGKSALLDNLLAASKSIIDFAPNPSALEAAKTAHELMRQAMKVAQTIAISQELLPTKKQRGDQRGLEGRIGQLTDELERLTRELWALRNIWMEAIFFWAQTVSDFTPYLHHTNPHATIVQQWRLNFNQDLTTYLRSKDQIPSFEQAVVMAHQVWFVFDLYGADRALISLFNSEYGIVTPDAIRAFEQIGMVEVAEVLRSGTRLLGDCFPLEQGLRQRRVEKTYNTDMTATPLRDLSVQCAELLATENGGYKTVMKQHLSTWRPS